MIFVIALLIGLILGNVIGYRHRELNDRIDDLIDRFNHHEEDEDVPAIIDTSPKATNARNHDSSRQEESAIINIKTPKQLAQEKSDKINNDLDAWTRG